MKNDLFHAHTNHTWKVEKNINSNNNSNKTEHILQLPRPYTKRHIVKTEKQKKNRIETCESTRRKIISNAKRTTILCCVFPHWWWTKLLVLYLYTP